MRLFVFVFFERNGAVEDQVFGSGIGVNVVIAGTRELQIVERLERLDIFFDKGTVVDVNAVGIEEGAHGVNAAYAVLILILLDGVARILAGPKASVVANFGG